MSVLQGMCETVLCRLTLDTKAETLLGKSPVPFPCPVLTTVYYPYLFLRPLFTTILLCIFDPCFSSWTRPPEIWNFLSFIGVETSQKRVLEKRSVVHVVKSILGGVIKGLIFLYFWGEKTALIWGTVTTGQ